MKNVFTILLCCLALTTAGQQKNEIPFEKLKGNWALVKPSGTIIGETWATKNDHEMSGKSFMVKKGDTTMLETVQLIKKGNDIFYIPVANGQNDDKPVPFKLTAVQGTAYIFENPEHDFPKRIVYDFTGTDTLHAYIDDGTEKKRQDFYYTKQK